MVPMLKHRNIRRTWTYCANSPSTDIRMDEPSAGQPVLAVPWIDGGWPLISSPSGKLRGAALGCRDRGWLVRDFYVTLPAWHDRLARSVTSRIEQLRARSTGWPLTLPGRASPLLMAWYGRWMSGAGTSGCRRPSWPGRLACAPRWSAGYWALARLIPRYRPLSPWRASCR